jgi:hypothetical protein
LLLKVYPNRRSICPDLRGQPDHVPRQGDRRASVRWRRPLAADGIPES